MAEGRNAMAQEQTKEIRVPLAVVVGERESEIPVAVPVTFAALLRIVERHLATGLEVHGLLLEHYADQVAPPRPAPRPRRGEPRPEPRGEPAAPAASGNGAAGFPAEEVAAWRG